MPSPDEGDGRKGGNSSRIVPCANRDSPLRTALYKFRQASLLETVSESAGSAAKLAVSASSGNRKLQTSACQISRSKVGNGDGQRQDASLTTLDPATEQIIRLVETETKVLNRLHLRESELDKDLEASLRMKPLDGTQRNSREASYRNTASLVATAEEAPFKAGWNLVHGGGIVKPCAVSSTPEDDVKNEESTAKSEGGGAKGGAKGGDGGSSNGARSAGEGGGNDSTGTDGDDDTRSQESGPRKRAFSKYDEETTSILTEWFLAHKRWPYPAAKEKDALAEATKLTTLQISNWFTNKRKRHWTPVIKKRTRSPRDFFEFCVMNPKDHASSSSASEQQLQQQRLQHPSSKPSNTDSLQHRGALHRIPGAQAPDRRYVLRDLTQPRSASGISMSTSGSNLALPGTTGVQENSFRAYGAGFNARSSPNSSKGSSNPLLAEAAHNSTGWNHNVVGQSVNGGSTSTTRLLDRSMVSSPLYRGRRLVEHPEENAGGGLAPGLVYAGKAARQVANMESSTTHHNGPSWPTHLSEMEGQLQPISFSEGSYTDRQNGTSSPVHERDDPPQDDVRSRAYHVQTSAVDWTRRARHQATNGTDRRDQASGPSQPPLPQERHQPAPRNRCLPAGNDSPGIGHSDSIAEITSASGAYNATATLASSDHGWLYGALPPRTLAASNCPPLCSHPSALDYPHRFPESPNLLCAECPGAVEGLYLSAESMNIGISGNLSGDASSDAYDNAWRGESRYDVISSIAGSSTCEDRDGDGEGEVKEGGKGEQMENEDFVAESVPRTWHDRLMLSADSTNTLSSSADSLQNSSTETGA